MQIFCDMDGVLTDFVKAVHPYIGVLTHQFYDDSPLWDVIIAGAAPNFWSHMVWTKDGKELWNVIAPHQPYILSAPSSRMPESVSGKIAWCVRELYIPSDRVVLASHIDKCKWATTGQTANVLIDDSARNIQQWENAGGIGVLHQSGNLNRTLHRLADLLHKC